LLQKLTPCTPYTGGYGSLMYTYNRPYNIYHTLYDGFTCINSIIIISYKLITTKFSCDTSTLRLSYVINRQESSNTRNKHISSFLRLSDMKIIDSEIKRKLQSEKDGFISRLKKIN